MSYEILLHPDVQKQFDKLDKNLQEIFIKKLEKIKQDPEVGKPLRYDLKGRRTVRFENYRIIYSIDYEKKQILVLDFEHRKKVYD